MQDYTEFANHYNSSPCNCTTQYPNPYSECSNLYTANADTMIAGLDFTAFGNHWGHEFNSGANYVAQAPPQSQGSLSVVFEEDNPLEGPRKLRAYISLENMEPYRAVVMALRNENPVLRYSKWCANRDYAGITMAAPVNRTGENEVLIGVFKRKPIEAGSADLGYIEFDVRTSDALELTADDLAVVRADVQTINGGVLGVSASQSRRTVKPPTFTNQLAQNYPNPFNPTTTIAYSIAETEQVRLVIYNVRGQLVRVLDSRIRTPNNYRVTWDGRDESGGKVSSGVYFYRITTRSFSDTRKMVLLR